eukprot:4184625-Prymnesium_polylepis.2
MSWWRSARASACSSRRARERERSVAQAAELGCSTAVRQRRMCAAAAAHLALDGRVLVELVHAAEGEADVLARRVRELRADLHVRRHLVIVHARVGRRLADGARAARTREQGAGGAGGAAVRRWEAMEGDERIGT